MKELRAGPPVVAMVIGGLDAGGAQRVLTRIATVLLDRGVQVHVITISGRADDFYELDDRVSRIALDLRRDSRSFLDAVWFNLRRVTALRAALRRIRADVALSFIGATNVLTALATAGRDIRFVVSERNDPGRQPRSRTWQMLARLTYRFADLVTANSEGALRTLESVVPPGKLRLLPNPAPNVVPEPARRNDVILSVGRLAHQKGFDILLEAFSRVADRIPSWELAIVGDGPLGAALREQAATLGLAGRVRWVGTVDDVGPYYLDASMFVLSSRFEGTPNVLLEAMANGLPPVVTDASPGPLEYVEDGATGSVVPSEDPAALADAILALAADDERRRRLGDAARARIECDDLESVLQAWSSVLGLWGATEPPR